VGLLFSPRLTLFRNTNLTRHMWRLTPDTPGLLSTPNAHGFDEVQFPKWLFEQGPSLGLRITPELDRGFADQATYFQNDHSRIYNWSGSPDYKLWMTDLAAGEAHTGMYFHAGYMKVHKREEQQTRSSHDTLERSEAERRGGAGENERQELSRCLPIVSVCVCLCPRLGAPVVVRWSGLLVHAR
jgi:hypothetical protein